MAGCAAPKDRPDPRRSQPQLAAARMRPGSEGPKKADFSYDSRPMGFGPATSGVEGRARDRRAEGMGWGGGEKQESERGKMGGGYREMKLFRIQGETPRENQHLRGLEGRDRKTQLRGWATAKTQPTEGVAI